MAAGIATRTIIARAARSASDLEVCCATRPSRATLERDEQDKNCENFVDVFKFHTVNFMSGETCLFGEKEVQIYVGTTILAKKDGRLS